MSNRTAGSTTLARKGSLVSTGLIKPVMNRVTRVTNCVVPVNEPITPVKGWVGDPKSTQR